jgi:hypothetical protein
LAFETFPCFSTSLLLKQIISGRRRRKNKRVREEENNEIDLAHADFQDSELVSDLNESKFVIVWQSA